jgi:opacity protein-like surface antigen
VFLGTNVSDNLSLQVEGLVSQRGVKGLDGSVETTFRLAYLDVPVLARFGNTTAGETHFHIFTGPQISFLLSAKESTEGISGSIDFKDELKSNEFGWTIGAGVEKGNVGVDLRYTHGLTNIDDSASDGAVKNRTLALMVGVRLK